MVKNKSLRKGSKIGRRNRGRRHRGTKRGGGNPNSPNNTQPPKLTPYQWDPNISVPNNVRTAFENDTIPAINQLDRLNLNPIVNSFVPKSFNYPSSFNSSTSSNGSHIIGNKVVQPEAIAKIIKEERLTNNGRRRTLGRKRGVPVESGFTFPERRSNNFNKTSKKRNHRKS